MEREPIFIAKPEHSFSHQSCCFKGGIFLHKNGVNYLSKQHLFHYLLFVLVIASECCNFTTYCLQTSEQGKHFSILHGYLW
jgi:hypothetical protein